jgi:hypothetical protein
MYHMKKVAQLPEATDTIIVSKERLLYTTQHLDADVKKRMNSCFFSRSLVYEVRGLWP